ncbi:MAG TPA: diguanylate cyclase [Lacipirellulaceae bacterium]|nr:diguanylate cyclase [Lacipirellulaceae bacterium]
MADAITPIVDAASAAGALLGSPGVDRRREETESRVAEISSLLSALEEAAAESSPKPTSAVPTAGRPHAAVEGPRAPVPAIKPADDHVNRLVQVRLGLASSLFAALQLKHAPTASHSLRVALGCSTWALHKRLDDETRDAVELASLLHDLGKIAAPDALLAKATPLTPQEAGELAGYCHAGVNILACCACSQRVLDAVGYAGARFDGQAPQQTVAGEAIPLESRMIAIVDAFDVLTSASPGAARSREQALAELSAGAGSLFDPSLVKQFIELLSHEHDALTAQVAGRWFNELGKRQYELPWQPQAPAEAPAEDEAAGTTSYFEQQLIDSMHDGVIFVNAGSEIFLWSKGAERLTGVSAAAASGRHFVPSLLDMCNTAGRRVRDEACPVARALVSGAQLRQRLEILGRQGTHVAIDLHAIPVHTAGGDLLGATVVLHDAEPEASLEEKCEALHAEVTKDPMTKVANRAEFDRMQALFMEAHQQAGLPCSLIMSDIDHFQQINDTYGHQAGDEAIITVANLLKGMCRSGDLVARYGGEEFAVLCADCDMAEAASRAEQIRRKLSETPHPALGTKRITASFGVAELQSGDTPEAMLRRADTGLLTAKEKGRNQVVQVGNRMPQTPKKKSWWSFGSLRPQPLIEAKLTTDVPIDIAIQKLRGFVSDQSAKILATRENHIELEIGDQNVGQHRRRSDRTERFRVEIDFSEQQIERSNNVGLARGNYSLSVAQVTIRPKRSRNRRQGDQSDRARLILQSLKAYLMAKEVNPAGEEAEHAASR